MNILTNIVNGQRQSSGSLGIETGYRNAQMFAWISFIRTILPIMHSEAQTRTDIPVPGITWDRIYPSHVILHLSHTIPRPTSCLGMQQVNIDISKPDCESGPAGSYKVNDGGRREIWSAPALIPLTFLQDIYPMFSGKGESSFMPYAHSYNLSPCSLDVCFTDEQAFWTSSPLTLLWLLLVMVKLKFSVVGSLLSKTKLGTRSVEYLLSTCQIPLGNCHIISE